MHRYCLVGLLFISQSVLVNSAQAEMYQWVDPESGTTQLSGKPPAWYRSAEGGPRVFVFNHGKVVDDTNIKISDEQRNALRRNAFIRAEEDRLAAQEKATQAAKLKAELDRNAQQASNQRDEMSNQDSNAQEANVRSGNAQTENQGDNQSDSQTKSLDQELAAESEELVTMDKAALEEESIEIMRALISEWENKRTEEAKKLLEN